MTGLMAPADAIGRLQRVPYVKGAGAWDGADCFGIVELWYRHVLGIEIDDRGSIQPGHSGIAAGVEAIRDWNSFGSPDDPAALPDHALILFRANRVPCGHIGVHWQGHVLHSDEHTGCVFEPLARRHLKHRMTGYLTRK